MSYCPPTVVFGFAPDSADAVVQALLNEPVKPSREDYFAHIDVAEGYFYRKSHFHDLALTTEAGRQQLLNASQQGPIFYYHTDHFIEFEYEDTEALESYEHRFKDWGYRIFHKGQEIATAEFNSSWPSYGDELKQHLNTIAQTANPDALSLFGLPAKNINKIKELLHPDHIYDLFLEREHEDIREEMIKNLTIDIFYPYTYPQ